jgi:hypothetical protein
MMKGLFLAAVALPALMCTSARSCEGQVGKTIYEDTFEDDSGGWDLSPPVTTIKPPSLLIALSGNTTNVGSQVLTFHAKEADYCLEGTVPKALAPDNNFELGLELGERLPEFLARHVGVGRNGLSLEPDERRLDEHRQSPQRA